ncbi:MAG: hypothetical protein VB035_02150 [Candidatus Fimivivens sp.]|nr:hypothetical protein [Candidatus Fimivivens sp.]
MEHKRVVKGNNTTVPTGAELLSAFETYAVTEKHKSGRGNTPLNSAECVVDSREFMIENKK